MTSTGSQKSSHLKRRIAQMRFDAAELSGALGDLGTFIPLAASMVLVCGLDAGTVLFFAGLFNVATGFLFNQPLPVQPMKAIAAVAIAEQLTTGEIAAAGFTAGLVILIIGTTGLATWAEKTIPRPVVRGIQLGVGLKLAAMGIGMIYGLSWLGLDSRLVALLGAVLILAGARFKRFPSALVLFTIGLAILFLGHGENFTNDLFGWAGPRLILPTSAQWKSGILHGALPQIPLTLLNSVIAVCALSADYFPGKGIRTRPMAISVGLMNIGGCLFGAMPVCHGSGGLAGQYRFGARTGGSVVMLGGAKILLALLFGSATVSLLTLYPAAVLGILLAFAGVELATPARDCKTRSAFFIAAGTAAGILAFNTWLGFLIGLGISALTPLTRNKKSPS